MCIRIYIYVCMYVYIYTYARTYVHTCIMDYYGTMYVAGLSRTMVVNGNQERHVQLLV